MKVYAFLFLLAVSTPSFAQSGKKKNKHNYMILINDTSFVSAMPEQGATLKAYFINDTISEIKTWFGFNFGEVTRDYFYWDDTLIVVNETQKLYSATAVPKINPDTIKTSYNGRYLFKKGQLTDISQKGSYSISDTPANKDETNAVLTSLSDKYRKLVYAKRAKKKNRLPSDK